MDANVGSFDRMFRVVIGIVLIAFALKLGFNDTGWNWIGWIGLVPLATAAFAYCPLYSFLGFSSCPARRRR